VVPLSSLPFRVKTFLLEMVLRSLVFSTLPLPDYLEASPNFPLIFSRIRGLR